MMSRIRRDDILEAGHLNDLRSQLIECDLNFTSSEELARTFNELYQKLQLINEYGISQEKLAVLFNDIYGICVQRMIQYSKLNKNEKGMVFFKGEEHRVKFQEIFNYILLHINHTFNPLINSLNNFLKKMITLVIVNEKNEEDAQLILQSWIDAVMKTNLNTKNFFNIIDIVSKSLTKKSYIFDNYPEFCRDSIILLESDTLANAVSKCLVTLYSGTYDREKELEWFESWKEIILHYLNESTEKIRQSLQVYLLPNLFQISPKSLQLLISQYSKNNDNIHIDNLIGLLKIGQNLSLVDPLESFSNDQLVAFLTHEHAKYRVNACELLLGGTYKNIKSQPIPCETYLLIKENHIIEIFLNDYEDVEIRNHFISILQQFITVRFKESIYGLNRQLKSLVGKGVQPEKQEEIRKLIESGEEFIQWLVKYLIHYLKVGSSYSQLSTSMKILQLIAEKIPEIINIYRDPLIFDLLIQNLFNNYENIRESSLELLIKSSPSSILVDYMENDNTRSYIVDQSCEILHCLKGRKSEGGAKALEFLAIYYLDFLQEPSEVISLVDILLERLSHGIQLAAQDTTQIFANEQFVHGYFKALNLIYSRFDKDFKAKHISFVSKFYDQIIEQCFTIWELERLWLSNSFDEEADEDDSMDELSGEHNAKVKLNHAWKVVKDSNLLLTRLLTDTEASKNALGNDGFLRCCELIIDQLASINHRGAFSSIYPSYISICEVCSMSEKFSSYPEIWLSQNLQLIESKTQFISRRSGGLPFLISGILIANKATKNSKNLAELTFKKLLEIANRPYEHIADEKIDIPQVHAFNCIKQMFIESGLVEISTHFVEESLDLALENFTNESWSVRNCAVMLFSSIQQRVFGSKKEPSYPSKLFFNKYPSVGEIMLRQLSVELDHQEGEGTSVEDNQSMLPILLILLKLDTVSSTEDKTTIKLKRILVRFLNNRFWKVREIIAKCLASFYTSSEFASFTLEFIDSVHSMADLNRIHGSLMTILEGLSKFKISDSAYETLETSIYSKAEHFLVHCKSFPIAKVYVDIIKLLAEKKNETLNKTLQDVFGHFFINCLTSDSDILVGGEQLALEVVNILLLKSYIRNRNYDTVIDLIRLVLFGKEFYHVQLATLTFIQDNFEELNEEGVLKTIAPEIWEIIVNNDSWKPIKSIALDLYADIMAKGWNAKFYTSDQLIILFGLVKRENNENIKMKSLECIGSLINFAADDNDYDVFLRTCEMFLEEENSVKYRQSSIQALTQFVNTFDNPLPTSNVYFGRAIVMLFSRGLEDDDEHIREATSQCLVSLFGFNYATNAVFMRHTFSTEIKKILDEKLYFKLFCQVLLENCLSSEEKSQLNQEFDDSSTVLFDTENSNLYKNDLESTKLLADLLLSYKDVIPTDFLDDFSTTVVSDLQFILQTFSSSEKTIFWSREESFATVTRAIMNGQMLLSFRKNAALTHLLDEIKNRFAMQSTKRILFDT
ncbi:putative death-receptor fusion protein-domain-containing protein [Scheffersomyces xylosifermentans]|uniref:putative death-receptor fusion protein-domain-containing protein n=1 Tax=Scheffersomyces xylosifermentans TaxID=1304137 RepID=UPI00315DB43B